MQLRPQQLTANLKSNIAPVYVVGGDETLLVLEAADAIRAAAKQAGYSERVVMEAETGFDWKQLGAEAASMSLFAEQRILDLRLPTGKPGTEGSKAISEYCKNPPPDTLLLVTCGKLEAASRKAKWFKALESAGAAVVAWPIAGNEVQRWLAERMRGFGLNTSREAVQALAERVEGNLLAAAQEVDKLLLLNGPGDVDVQAVLDAVSDSSRFDIFDLVDAALSGSVSQVEKTLQGLRAEGTEPVLLLWALNRELRQLHSVVQRAASSGSVERAMDEMKVWKNRRQPIGRAAGRLRPAQLRRMLQHSAQVDRVIKGQQAGRVWDELLQLSLTLASGKPVVALAV